jgi:hypothetical protein
MGRGCLFWLLISVLLSVTLTVVVNLVLFVVSGLQGWQGAGDTLGYRQEPKPRVLYSPTDRVPV